MSKKSAPSVVLLWGEDAFLLREDALQVIGDVQPVEVDADEWQGGELADLSTPSLFGERRVLLINDAKQLSAAALKEVAHYCEAPMEDALLVLAALVGERTKAPPAALLKIIEPIGTVKASSAGDITRWVLTRAKNKGLEISPAAVNALVDVVGGDTGELDQALDQLGNAFAGQPLTPERVAAQFRGVGDAIVWDLCDRTFERNLPGTVRSLRSLLAAREEPIMLLGVISARVRELLKVKSIPDGTPLAQVATLAGFRSDWQVKRPMAQARNFSMDELVGIHAALVAADRSLKSGADGSIVLTALVTQIAGRT